MAGVTDAPFRDLAWRYGAGYVVSEMVSAKAELWNTDKSRLRRQRIAGECPFAVQVAGGDPDTVAGAAARHWRDGADIIDINFGCPAKKVCRKAAGSQLLGNELLVADIVAAAVKAVPIPVTAKIRSGYSPENRNGVRIAKILEQEGVQAIVVHGRTRACRFHGAVEYDTIAEIKTQVSVPVIANGDICSPSQARSVLDYTAADGVMIGRAALGAPWLLGQIAGTHREPPVAEKMAVLIWHVKAVQRFYGPPGVRIIRKHVRWYLENIVSSEAQLGQLLRCFNRIQDPQEQIDFLEQFGGRQTAWEAA